MWTRSDDDMPPLCFLKNSSSPEGRHVLLIDPVMLHPAFKGGAMLRTCAENTWDRGDAVLRFVDNIGFESYQHVSKGGLT